MATFLPQLPVTLIVTFPQFLPLIVDISVEIIKSGFLPLTLIANFNYNSNVQNLASSFSEILIQFSSKFVHFRSLYIRFLSKGFEPETNNDPVITAEPENGNPAPPLPEEAIP